MLSKVGLPWLGCCVRFAGLGLLLFPVLSPILAGMLCPPPYCLRSCLLACLPSWLGCRVCVLGLSPKFHVRFVQLFGVYGGVIIGKSRVLLRGISTEPKPVWVRQLRKDCTCQHTCPNSGDCFSACVGFRSCSRRCPSISSHLKSCLRVDAFLSIA